MKKSCLRNCLVNKNMLDKSNCCGAPIILPDICQDCHEHCAPEEEEEDNK